MPKMQLALKQEQLEAFRHLVQQTNAGMVDIRIVREEAPLTIYLGGERVICTVVADDALEFFSLGQAWAGILHQMEGGQRHA